LANVRREGGEEQIPAILQGKAINPFISKEILEKSRPIRFRTPSGVVASGYRADLLPDVCEIYSVPRHPENVGVGFGLVCSDFESISAWSLDGDRELIPSWLVTYRDVPAGTCRARAIVNRRDGSQLRGESGPVIIRGDD
jgi:hypothetical protein